MVSKSEKLSIIKDTIRKEGGLVDHPQDPGGLTNFGISIRWFETVGGTRKQLIQLTKDQAAQLYDTYFWDDFGVGYELADKLFDLGVNMGKTQRNKLLQRALSVKDDGIIGPVTKSYLKYVAEEVILLRLKEEAAKFYLSLNKDVFLKGWLRRLYE